MPIGRISAIARLSARRGWDVEALLRSAGVSPSLLTQGRFGVTADQLSEVIKQLRRETDDELIGLGLAPAPPGTIRMVGLALLAGASDLGRALRLFQEFQRCVPGFPPIHVTTEASRTTLSFDITAINEPADLLTDLLLAAAHRTLSWVTCSRIPLRQVNIPHRQPVNVDDYDLIFGAPVVFSATTPALVFDSAALAAPIVRTQDEVVEFFTQTPGAIIARRDYGRSLTDRVHRILQRHLSGDWPTADDVAVCLALSPQTVRRKLREKNTSLTQIKEDILRDAALTSLAQGGETVAALSQRLGFSEPSAFTRAFRRWTGSPPKTYRLQTRVGYSFPPAFDSPTKTLHHRPVSRHRRLADACANRDSRLDAAVARGPE